MPARTSKEQEEKAVLLYQQGLAVPEINRQCGIGGGTLDKIRKRLGVPDRARNHYGARSPTWTGGRRVTKDGYVMVYLPLEHPLSSMRNRAGVAGEHRIAMAESLGRPLESYETVHHINGVRSDNRLENLQLRLGHHGPGAALRCANCGSVDLEHYELETAYERQN